MPATTTATRDKAWGVDPEEIQASDLTADDILSPNEYYGRAGIYKVLGIRNAFAEAIRRASPPCYFSWLKGGTHARGDQIIAWLKAENVHYTVTPAGLELYKIRQRIAARAAQSALPKPKPEPVTTSNKVAARIEECKAQAQRERDDWSAHAERRYVELIQRESLSETEIQELASIMTDLEIEPEQMREDRARIIPKIRELEAWHDEREKARRQAIEAREAYNAMEERHREEERRLFTKKQRAGIHAADCAQAAFKLEMLKRQRPILFDASTVPPRLRKDG